MNLTEDMRRAAALLGLDPENPRHRDLLAKCIDKALAQPPARGRPKGTGLWDDAKLSGLAHLVDFLKNVLAMGGNSISDTEILEGACWGFRDDGVVFRANTQKPEVTELIKIAFPPSMDRTISTDTMRNLLPRGRRIMRLQGGMR